MDRGELSLSLFTTTHEYGSMGTCNISVSRDWDGHGQLVDQLVGQLVGQSVDARVPIHNNIQENKREGGEGRPGNEVVNNSIIIKKCSDYFYTE